VVGKPAQIGVLALQGAFESHIKTFSSIGERAIPVKNVDELMEIKKLVIPGGESTAISMLLEANDLRSPLIERLSQGMPVFGTCAGMIMLSSRLNSNNVDSLGIMDFDIDRNAWGRQVNSFTDKVKLSFDSKSFFNGIFIRAPKIKSVGSKVKIIAKYKTEPVMVSDGRHIACSFHPELGNDNRIHSYFMEKIND